MMFKLLLASSTLYLLSSCGGSSPNSPATNPTTPPTSPSNPIGQMPNLYNGLTSAAEITEQNIEKFSKVIFGDMLKIAENSADSSDESQVVGERLIGSCGGDAAFVSDIDPSTLLGELSLNFSDFDDCSGTKINGELVLDVLEVEISTEEITKVVFNFKDVDITGEKTDLTFAGELVLTIDFENYTELYTTELFEVNDNFLGSGYRLENYSELNYFYDSSFVNLFELSISGRLFIAEEGYVDITTQGDAVCIMRQRTDCRVDAQKFGSLKLTNTNAAQATFSFLEYRSRDYTSVLNIEIDLDGNKQVDYFKVLPLEPESEAIFAYAGPDFELIFAANSPVELNASKSINPLGRDLSFSWSAVGSKDRGTVQGCSSPHTFEGDTINLILGDTSSETLNFEVSQPGDYCFTVKIDDGMSNPSTDYVVVRFKALDLYDTTFIPLSFDDVRFDSAQTSKATDLNNDQRLDLLVRQDGVVHTYLQTEGHSFVYGSALNMQTPNLSDAWALADLNNDGKEDIVVLDTRDSFMLIYYPQNDQQSFGDAIQIGSSSVAGRIDIGDFNGDGKNDVLVNGYDAIELFLQSDTDFDNVLRYTLEDAVSEAYRSNYGESTSGDFDGDGILDIGLTTYRYYDDTETIHILRVKDNQFELIEQLRLPLADNRHFFGFTIADLDQDGDGDLLLFNFNDILLVKNTENGMQASSLEIAPAIKTGGMVEEVINLVDINKDGRLDILLSADYAYTHLYFQDSNGGFEDTILIPFISESAVFTDINADGFEDILSTTSDVISLRLGKPLN